jgi:uncharacterized protein DUF1203
MSFRISGLPTEPFAGLFDLSDGDLREHGAVRRIAEHNAPCRISLTDAQPGDEVLLVNYEHHPVDSPYRMRFAIYVRRGEEQYEAVNQVPEQLRTRMLAVRAFRCELHDGGVGGCRRSAIGRGHRTPVHEPFCCLSACALCRTGVLCRARRPRLTC